jgi:hypothetical protein
MALHAPIMPLLSMLSGHADVMEAQGTNDAVREASLASMLGVDEQAAEARMGHDIGHPHLDLAR